jgi:hypothetical protein
MFGFNIFHIKKACQRVKWRQFVQERRVVCVIAASCRPLNRPARPLNKLRMKAFPLLVLLLALSRFLSAQSFPDCTSALEICNKQTLHFNGQFVPGSNTNELGDAVCFTNGSPIPQPDHASAWIRFTAATSGSFFFTATPDTAANDLDFVFYRLINGDCADREVLRCMASGDINYPSPCMGPTGLAPGETDVSGAAGCLQPDPNNFLAPVDLVAGETYALVVNNFTLLAGFTVEFCGTALLGDCDTAECTALGAVPVTQAPEAGRLRVFPNPAGAAGRWTVKWNAWEGSDVRLTVYDALGRAVLQRTQYAAARTAFAIDGSALPAGTYRLEIEGAGQRKVVSLVR